MLNSRDLAIWSVLVKPHTELGIDAIGKADHGRLIYNNVSILRGQERLRGHGSTTLRTFMPVLSFCSISDHIPFHRLFVVIVLSIMAASIKTHESHVSSRRLEKHFKSVLIIPDLRGYFNVKV